MANLNFLKSYEQGLDKNSFVPKRNIWNYRLIHNSTIEEQLSDSNEDEDRTWRIYAMVGYAIVGYSRVSYGDSRLQGMIDYSLIGNSIVA